MNNRSLLIVTLVALLAMFVVLTASAAQEKGASASPAVQSAGAQSSEPSERFAGPPHHSFGLEAIMKKLGITDEQKKQLRGLYVGFRDKTRKARTELMSLRDEKKTMLLSGKVDQQKLAQIDEQVVKLRSEVMREALKLKRDRLAILTPEQLDRVADLEAEKAFRHKMHMRHPGPMHGPEGGPGHE